MKPRTPYIWLALLLILGAGYFALGKIMALKPEVTFVTLKGAKIELRELRGSPVLVSFWASDCAACIEEMPSLVGLHETYSAKGLQIIGVAMDYDIPSHVVELAEFKHLPYPIAIDLQGRYASAFGGVRWVPDGFLIGPEGEVVYHWQGLPDLPKLKQKIEQYL